MQTEQQHKLWDSLREDARQFSACEEGQQVAAVYHATLKRLSARPGYPRLYRCAWRLLAQCAAQGEWDTLQRVFDVLRAALPTEGEGEGEAAASADADWLDEPYATRDRISQWHLKAVLYCWAYLRDARELGQGAEHDAALLAPERRRSDEDGAEMLRALRPLHCFVNMEPREAHNALEYARGDPTATNSQRRPYLFRLSTTLPGFITLSMLTPLSKRALDMRVSPWEAREMLHTKDLYSLLYQTHVDPAGTYDAAALVELARRLEVPRHFDAVRALLRVLQMLPLQCSQVYAAQAVPLLKRAFWPRVTTRQLAPESAEARVGLTPSYIGCYDDGTATPARCGNCETGGLRESIREPLNGQLYCGEQCYAADFAQCY